MVPLAASSRNTGLVCQLKRSVRKRPGVPGQQTHIDRIGQRSAGLWKKSLGDTTVKQRPPPR